MAVTIRFSLNLILIKRNNIWALFLLELGGSRDWTVTGNHCQRLPSTFDSQRTGQPDRGAQSIAESGWKRSGRVDAGQFVLRRARSGSFTFASWRQFHCNQGLIFIQQNPAILLSFLPQVWLFETNLTKVEIFINKSAKRSQPRIFLRLYSFDNCFLKNRFAPSKNEFWWCHVPLKIRDESLNPRRVCHFFFLKLCTNKLPAFVAVLSVLIRVVFLFCCLFCFTLFYRLVLRRNKILLNPITFECGLKLFCPSSSCL